MKRSDFIKSSLFITGSMITGRSILPKERNPYTADTYPPELVKEFVSAGHNDLEKVKEMLHSHPNLLYACWDWGNGDFETAIEGAGHMGNREIALYLIKKGARPNIFTHCMLGHKEMVLAQIEAFPSLLRSKGPHGFSLLHHAKAGGEASTELWSALQQKGLEEVKFSMK